MSAVVRFLFTTFVLVAGGFLAATAVLIGIHMYIDPVNATFENVSAVLVCGAAGVVCAYWFDRIAP